ncbi:MAG TPA: TA system VapC family ribonuclease toxin [Anaeromyxobacteraceae bacterium]|nr:TA system VapC family ribonuclease toxin [Anaeromyxobacteraceae bacterium]
MTVALLDTNVLLALAWPNHQHHAPAHRWFARSRDGWATCALTELAFVRLSSNPAFTRDAVSPRDAVRLLARLRKLPGHRAWDSLPAVADLDGMALIGHQQINDAYLLLVAQRHRGVLATFDARIAGWAGTQRHVAVIEA